MEIVDKVYWSLEESEAGAEEGNKIRQVVHTIDGMAVELRYSIRRTARHNWRSWKGVARSFDYGV